MSGVPDAEQLRRIAHGVRHRIGRRRRVAARIGAAAGVAGALALVVGGVALVLPGTGSPSGASAGGSGGGSAADSSAVLTVTCHAPGRADPAEADGRRLPGSALEACATALASGASVAASPGATVRGHSAGSASPSSLPGVVCRADDGALHVYPDRTGCTEQGMTRIGG